MAAFPIVAVQTFIEAIRDSGYKTTSAAIAELVDNAIEAGASTVDIEVNDVPTEDGRKDTVVRVIDDGCGMSADVMQLALQFGGSTRFNSRSGAGRYGMGLPCSSLSLARRVEVLSWSSPKRALWTYLDVDEIVQGALTAVPAAVPANGKLSAPPSSPSGTTVLLSKCDRLQYKRTPALVSRLRRDLGQTFRCALVDGVTIRVDRVPIEPADPLFLVGSKPRSGKPYGPPLEFPVRVPDTGRTSSIKLIFSELPIQDWAGLSNEEKAAIGISKGAGVSILRHGREIDYGWYFMGDKRRENYDDWWRCQVEFEPVLDELFGVTHSKQKINPTETLNRLLVPHVEPIARELNSRVRRAFLQLHDAVSDSKPARRAAAGNSLLEPPTAPGPRSTASSAVWTRATTKRIKGLRYRIRTGEVDDLAFFTPSLSRGELRVTVNELHPFFERVYAAAGPQPTHGLDHHDILQMLLLAFGRAECGLRGGEQRAVARALREKWSVALSAFLD